MQSVNKAHQVQAAIPTDRSRYSLVKEHTAAEPAAGATSLNAITLCAQCPTDTAVARANLTFRRL